MFTNQNFYLAQQIHEDRHKEILNQVRLHELSANYRAQRRETMKRFLGLLRVIALTRMTGLVTGRIVARGA